eukprot:CAMPEP_0201513510 /NCGR_PEP_ID=MMETSP0161_2-20130828/5553_1 /ASSEMBLY_ACC=CAM_ASM_000251 /TAXON_ID=180227 /ORGANISM="Neoparamoeba aestuarina, Strain SoJaBio B1-5/56/2" /LENGTH=226 /DNA_ID=CAMNT_0047909755 /DNA_START=94 /DNA_END=775 /DNA_ORIENTATION=-
MKALDFVGKRPDDWSVVDVKGWLRCVGMEWYQPLFERGGVTGSILMGLEEQDLMRLGVKRVSHIQYFMKVIDSLVVVLFFYDEAFTDPSWDSHDAEYGCWEEEQKEKQQAEREFEQEEVREEERVVVVEEERPEPEQVKERDSSSWGDVEQEVEIEKKIEEVMEEKKEKRKREDKGKGKEKSKGKGKKSKKEKRKKGKLPTAKSEFKLAVGKTGFILPEKLNKSVS